MVDHSNVGARVCVIGRTSFDSGIGAFSHAACELFSRHFPTCIIPTDRADGDDAPVLLPSGRSIPVCTDPSDVVLSFYADVLVNNTRDVNLSRMPGQGLRIAHFCFDSDELPPEWVFALNSLFDGAYVPTISQQDLALRSGVRVPVGVLPIALPLESLLARPARVPGERIRIGSVGAFHERKELLRLVEAFAEEFGPADEVELILHSNLSFGDGFERTQSLVRKLGARRVTLSNAPLGPSERDEFLALIDVFVNCSRGEGYSIGAREALALGKALVLTDLGVHLDLTELPGVHSVPTSVPVPGHYPEIDDRCFGQQYRPSVADLRVGLRSAVEDLRTGGAGNVEAVRVRRNRAADFSFTDLSIEYASILDPEAAGGRNGRGATRSTGTWHPGELIEAARGVTGRHRGAAAGHQQVIVPSYDGGFFSVFNSYLSHLAWGLQDDRCLRTLPDWDQTRLSERMGSESRESFCYGRPEDGNLWASFFEPPFGCTTDDLDDPEFLYANAVEPNRRHNEQREPLLTYTHAYDLYRSPWFPRFRRQYNEAYVRHVTVDPAITGEIDRLFDAEVEDRVLIAAHVKHPSHVFEQPGGELAATSAYLDGITGRLDELGVAAGSDDWRLFLATDQDVVVRTFTERFGGNVVSFADVRRTTVAEDDLFVATTAADPGVSGFQVQHLVSADPNAWSTRMAVGVLRDAIAMSRADTLFHIVSNVSTAVSYMNPEVSMRFVDPGLANRKSR